MNDNIGINLEKIDKLILDLYDYCEKINKTLNQASEVVDSTKSFYVGDIADLYRNKFDMYKSNFPIIISNLTSYADDLINLKSKINLLDDSLTAKVKNASMKVANQSQPIPSVCAINVNAIPKSNIGASKKWR